MKINHNIINSAKGVSFGIYDKTVKNEENRIVYRNSTKLFRDDVIWKDLMKLLKDRFKAHDKVSVYCLACSDGSEPYSLAASLKTNLEDSDKYFPIIASDIDKEVIDLAKKGVYEINQEERRLMRQATNGRAEKYFENDGPRTVKVNNELKKGVKFELKDALSCVEAMPKGTKIILCRNMWPYLSSEEREVLLKKLKEKMDKDSLLIIGSFDQASIMLDCKLGSEGFKNIHYTNDDLGMTDNNIWEKSYKN